MRCLFELALLDYTATQKYRLIIIVLHSSDETIMHLLRNYMTFYRSCHCYVHFGTVDRSIGVIFCMVNIQDIGDILVSCALVTVLQRAAHALRPTLYPVVNRSLIITNIHTVNVLYVFCKALSVK